MKRKFLIFLLAVTMVLATAVPGAYAAPRMDPDGLDKMTLTLSMPQNLNADLTGIVGPAVQLYLVAEADVSGNYSKTEAFSGLNLEIFNKDTAAAAWEANIHAAVEIVKNNSVAPAITATMPVADDAVSPLTISFKDYTPGIYLVMVGDTASLYYDLSFQPMMVAMPGNSYRTVQVPAATEPAATTPAEGDTESSGSESEAVPAADVWEYQVRATLKPEIQRQKGQLEIVKTLDKFATITGTVSFVFKIQGTEPKKNDTDPDVVVYSNVVAISFDNYGSKKVTLTDIPMGLDYTVTEVYRGGSYKLVWDGYEANDGVVVLSAAQFADKSATASFENDYDNRLIPGNGVVNEFHMDEQDEWKWTSADRVGESSSAVGGNASAG